MMGDKKTLGDVWEISSSSDKGEGESSDEGGDGAGPVQMKMERMAKQLGIEDLDTFCKLVRLAVENG
jgi:hypothetical protein